MAYGRRADTGQGANVDFLLGAASSALVGALFLYICMRMARVPLPVTEALWLATIPVVVLSTRDWIRSPE
jgi:ABC-type branched-subunit amino acid transport system permease subunit